LKLEQKIGRKATESDTSAFKHLAFCSLRLAAKRIFLSGQSG